MPEFDETARMDDAAVLDAAGSWRDSALGDTALGDTALGDTGVMSQTVPAANPRPPRRKVRMQSLIFGLLLVTAGSGAIISESTTVGFAQIASVGLFISGVALIAVLVARRAGEPNR